MQNKHTPAPWIVRKDNNEKFTIIHQDEENKSHVAVLDNAPLCEEHGESEANARLIAAAPELLAALEALQDAFIHVEGNTKGNKAKTEVIKYNDDIREALNAARELRWRIEGK